MSLTVNRTAFPRCRSRDEDHPLSVEFPDGIGGFAADRALWRDGDETWCQIDQSNAMRFASRGTERVLSRGGRGRPGRMPAPRPSGRARRLCLRPRPRPAEAGPAARKGAKLICRIDVPAPGRVFRDREGAGRAPEGAGAQRVFGSSGGVRIHRTADAELGKRRLDPRSTTAGSTSGSASSSPGRPAAGSRRSRSRRRGHQPRTRMEKVGPSSRGAGARSPRGRDAREGQKPIHAAGEAVIEGGEPGGVFPLPEPPPRRAQVQLDRWSAPARARATRRPSVRVRHDRWCTRGPAKSTRAHGSQSRQGLRSPLRQRDVLHGVRIADQRLGSHPDTKPPVGPGLSPRS